EQGTLVLEVNTLSQPPGANTWGLHIHYRAGSTALEETLQLTAQLITDISVQPATMAIFADQAVGHEITLIDRRDRPLSITAFRPSSPHLRAQLTDQYRDVQARAICKVRLQVDNDFPPGRHEEFLAIQTNDPEYPELKVAITVNKRSKQRLTPTPESVTL